LRLQTQEILAFYGIALPLHVASVEALPLNGGITPQRQVSESRSCNGTQRSVPRGAISQLMSEARTGRRAERHEPCSS